MKKGKSQTKYYLKNTNRSKMPQKTRTTKNSISKNFKLNNYNTGNLEQEIHEMTKKIENTKINLRLLKERLEQRKKTLIKLQGRPIKNLSSEEKDKYRITRLNQNKNHKYNEPIKRKIGKEREIIDAKIKMEKEKEKNENEFERLGEEIDKLVKNNTELKKEIQAKRKQMLELEKIKERIKQDNKNKEDKLNDMLKKNKYLEKSVKNNDFKKTVLEGYQQEKDFSIKRDELEQEYQKIIQKYIKRERENLKQKEFNRQVAELRNGGGSKFILKINKGAEIQKELKKIEDDKIGDRTPILDECLQKWREVNKEKKDAINKYIKNCTKVREALENLAMHLELNSISDLPEIFQKTEQRLSNINFQKERLENEQNALEVEKNRLEKQIELLETKKKGMTAYKKKFFQQQKEKIKIIDNITENLKKSITIREEFFQKLQGETDKFLLKFNETYLSEFIYDKINVDENKKYNYKTINKYLSNVEDYLNLIQYWNGNNNIEDFEAIEKQNLDKLREDMKKKLEGFETKRIMNKSLYNSMNIERKNGKGFKEIIRKTSSVITGQIKDSQNYMKNINNNKNNSIYNKNNQSNAYSQDLTQDGNYRYGNDSQVNQQSSIYYPNNLSLISHK